MRGRSDERRVLRGAAAVCGWTVAFLTTLLIADGLAERGRVASEKTLIAALEERILSDASVAPELAAATERQTERSVARERRNRGLAWVLLASTILFLVAVKRLEALGATSPGSVPGGERLVHLGSGLPRASTALLGPAEEVGPLPVEPDLAAVDQIVARTGTAREMAIPILQALQSHYRYLPAPALQRVCELTEVEPAEIVGVASFYSQFRRTPVGRHCVRICHGTACHVAGVEPIMDELRRRLKIPEDRDSDAGLRFTLDPVNCLGCCSLAPVMMIDDRVAGRLTPTSACEALAEEEGER
jgi:NADH:ubiquinone oxidoreductase subunit E